MKEHSAAKPQPSNHGAHGVARRDDDDGPHRRRRKLATKGTKGTKVAIQECCCGAKKWRD